MDENGVWKKPDMPITNFKAGGPTRSLVNMARRFAKGGRVVVGPVMGPTGGREDKLPVEVPHNAYVIPADVVSHHGQGNTGAGMEKMKKLFGTGIAHNVNGTSMPMSHLAVGGKVPIMISDGEYVVSPDEVARRGGGSVEIGNKVLDKFVLDSRADHIKTLSNLPGPAQ